MPTDTFANLSEEKRRRVFEAAVQEFSTRRFSEASINQIVKSAGISRGSFYQYFADKEDLYLYMLTEIGKEKIAILGEEEALHPDADFFAVLQHMMRSLLKWARARPQYHQIGLLMELDESQVVTKLRRRLPDGFVKLGELIERDQRRGLIKPEVESELILEMYVAMILHVLRAYYRSGADDERLLQKMDSVYQVLKEGIACV